MNHSTTTQFTSFNEQMDKKLLRSLGIVCLTVNMLCVLFNVLLSSTIFRGYFNNKSSLYLPNGLMIIFHDSYYYLQLLIAVYRFVSMKQTPNIMKFFERKVIHMFAFAIWCWCLAVSMFMVSGDCIKLFRPRYHYMGIYCEANGVEIVDKNSRYYLLIVLECVNISLPFLSIIVYVIMYLRMCFYHNRKINRLRRTQPSAPQVRLPCRLCLVISTGDVNSSKNIRIIYQGILLVLVMTFSPAFHFIFEFLPRPYTHSAYIICAYAFLYINSFTNFIIFFVFNTQIRKLMQRNFSYGKTVVQHQVSSMYYVGTTGR